MNMASSKTLWETATDNLPSRYNWKWVIRSIIGQPLLIAATMLAAVAIAIAIVVSGVPSYSASATVQVTNLRMSMSGRDDAYFAESQFDPSFVETQVQIINSETVANAVIEGLSLQAPPEKPGLVDDIKAYLSNLLGKAPAQDDSAAAGDVGRAGLLRHFSESLKVQRIGQSDLIEIRYTDKSPAVAATIANDIAEKYMAKINSDRVDSAQAGSSWLRARLQEIGPKARVISRAAIPTGKDGLSGMLVIALAAGVGLAVAAFIALTRELLNTTIRSPEQLRDVCGVECIGMVPYLPGSASARLNKVLKSNFSPLWLALRQAAVIADGAGLGTSMRTVGFTSTLPGEGKTLMAANFASMIASSGKKVLLVDAQPYNPSISKALSPTPKRGLLEFLSSETESIDAFTSSFPEARYDVLPLGEHTERNQVSQLLWSDGMQRFFAGTEQYDMVVFDLPPMIAGADLRAAANHLDGLFHVTQWGKVPEQELRSALALVPSIREAIGGVIINKVKQRKMRVVFSPEANFLKKQQLLAKKK